MLAFLASLSVITPCDVEIIAIPKPFNTLGNSSFAAYGGNNSSEVANAVAVGIGHAGPAFAVAKEIGREPCAVTEPVGVGLQIERVGRSGKRRHGHHADEHAQHQQGTEEFGYSSFHGLPP